MAAEDVALATLAQAQHGLLVAVHRGVYRHAAVPESPSGDLMAAVLASGAGALASHRSAGRLWRLRDVPRWRPEVTVCRTSRPKVPGVVTHRTDTLDAEDVAAADGIPVTSVARSLLD